MHPTGLAGYMIYFGTGKYIENGDKTPVSSPRHTFYGVWDKNYTTTSTPVVRADLLPQTLDQTTLSGFNVRTVTNTAITWRESGNASVGEWICAIPLPRS